MGKTPGQLVWEIAKDNLEDDRLEHVRRAMVEELHALACVMMDAVQAGHETRPPEFCPACTVSRHARDYIHARLEELKRDDR